MAKTIKVDTEVIRKKLLVSIDKALSKIDNSYNILLKETIPDNFIYKNNILKMKEQLYNYKQELLKIKTSLTSIANKFDLETNVMLEDLQLINHFQILSIFHLR